MKKALAIILCAILIQFKLLAEFGGQQRIGGYQEPDLRAAQALEEAKAAYQALEIQEAQEAAKEEILRQQQQAEEAARQQQVRDRLEELRQNALQKTQDAALAEMSVSNLIESALQNKKLIPVNPWRQIFGVKKYVKSPNSGFIKFVGSIQQITTQGVLITGNYGDNGVAGTDFFVENFPYRSYGYSVGDNLFTATNIYVALPDGTFTYVAVNGSIQNIPELNYGEPCSRPQDAATTEAAAKKLTPDEEQQINSAKDNAKQKTNEAEAAATALQAFIQEIEDEAESKIRAKNAPQNKALKYNQEQAAKGDPYGLLRMGQRCRDGDGVPKDLTKARQYLTRAANIGSSTAAKELARLNQPLTTNAIPILR
jgi:hypothetical protein